MSYKIYTYKNDDGKIIYVGQTKQKLSTRDRQHKNSKSLVTDFDKFMSKNKHLMPEIVYECNDKMECDRMERLLIKKYDTFDNGFNATRGNNPLLRDFLRALNGTYFFKIGNSFDENIADIKRLKSKHPSLYDWYCEKLYK